MIYILENYNETEINPITNKPFDETWIAFILTDSNDYQINVGRKKDSIYTVKVSKNYPNWTTSLFDFIEFNQANDKNIILSVKESDYKYAQKLYKNHHYNDNYLRDYEPKVIVHSTSMDNWINIQKDNSLKCWNVLKKEINYWEDSPIGKKLGDPLEFSDYIMFSNGSISSELVVASKQKNEIIMDAETKYTPGVRLYFDADKIARAGLLIRDGIHLKVKNSLDLTPYLLWYATWENIGLEQNLSTPREFTEKTNYIFNKLFNHSI